MRVNSTLLVSILALFSIITWATPGSGFLFNVILNRAQAPGELYSDAAGEAADGSKWHLQLKTEGAPSDFVVKDVALAPGGYSDCHTHPGPVLITVKQGTASWYDADCVLHTYTAGMAFIEDSGANHFVRNESATENLRLINSLLFRLASGPASRRTRHRVACLKRANLELCCASSSSARPMYSPINPLLTAGLKHRRQFVRRDHKELADRPTSIDQEPNSA
jgi:quercetin dioxygenase-like cupin family protein